MPCYHLSFLDGVGEYTVVLNSIRRPRVPLHAEPFRRSVRWSKQRYIFPNFVKCSNAFPHLWPIRYSKKGCCLHSSFRNAKPFVFSRCTWLPSQICLFQPAVRLKTILKPHEKAWACFARRETIFSAFCGFCNSGNFSSDPAVTRYIPTDFVRQEVSVTRYWRIDFTAVCEIDDSGQNLCV